MPTAEISIKTNAIYSKWASDYEGRLLILFGGAGSGKSIYGIQKFVNRMVQESDANHRFLFIRKVATTIRESIYDQTKKAISKIGVQRLCSVNKSDKTITFNPNGNSIIFLGVDDREKLKSLSDITGIFIEEGTELEEADFMQINLRLRGFTPRYKQIVIAFNPISKDHWLLRHTEPQLLEKIPQEIKNLRYLYEHKVWEFEKEIEDEDGNLINSTTRVLNTTYKDNRFIDPEYKAELRLLGNSSRSYSDVYEHGRWGMEKRGDLFVFTFDQNKHVKNCERNAKNTLHFTVDFNVRPYMSGLVMELEYITGGFWGKFDDYWNLKVIDEISNEYPKNTAQDLGETFATAYNPIEGFFMYGDASGLKNLGVKDTKTHFADLEKGLGNCAFNIERRTPSQNPRYKNIAPNSLGRKAFLNLLFSNELPCRIQINSRCKNLISDLKYCLQDGDGKLLKKKNKDGVEERGHHLDAFQYFICHPDTLGYLAKI